MKQLNRYDFANDKSFSTFLLVHEDTKFHQVPECDVIALEREDGIKHRTLFMRPDEALILARLLIDAVWQVTEGYTIGEAGNKHEFQSSLVEKHAACVHRWLRRDDNSLLCLNCDIVKLPLAPTPMVNYQAPNETWGLGSGIDDC